MAIELSFPRLVQLIRRQWFENSRLYLFSLLALVGLTSLVLWCWVLAVGQNYEEEIVYFIFIIGLYLSGFVFASFSFNALSDKTRATYWLSSPASHLEKLLCVIFYSTILFTVVYCLIFYLLGSIAINYVQELALEHPTEYHFRPVNWTESFGDMFSFFMYGFIAIQAFYLLGSVYFSRYPFVMTTIAGAAIIFIFVYYTAELSEAFFGGQYSWQGTKVIGLEADGDRFRSYELSPFVTNFLLFIFKFIWAPVFWVATWYRLKEKQV